MAMAAHRAATFKATAIEVRLGTRMVGGKLPSAERCRSGSECSELGAVAFAQFSLDPLELANH
eukprot:4887472-Pleurochrysis_carterae.AAC.1